MTPEKQHELADRFDLAFGKMNYLLNIDEARRIVYHETPKVACTSIKKYMIDQASGSPVEMLFFGCHENLFCNAPNTL